MQVQSLASLCGLRIRHCRELGCRSQTQLWFDPEPGNLHVLGVQPPPKKKGEHLLKNTDRHSRTKSLTWHQEGPGLRRGSPGSPWRSHLSTLLLRTHLHFLFLIDWLHRMLTAPVWHIFQCHVGITSFSVLTPHSQEGAGFSQPASILAPDSLNSSGKNVAF